MFIIYCSSFFQLYIFSNDEATRLFMNVGNRGKFVLIEQPRVGPTSLLLTFISSNIKRNIFHVILIYIFQVVGWLLQQ